MTPLLKAILSKLLIAVLLLSPLPVMANGDGQKPKAPSIDYWTGETVVLSEGDLFAAIKASIAVPGLFSPVPRGDRLLIDGGTSNPLPFDLLSDSHDLVVAIDVTGSRAPGDETEVELTEVFFNTFEIMQQSIISARMEHSRPDIYIKPDTRNIRLLHFNRIKQVTKQAEPAAKKLKQQLLEFLGKKKEKETVIYLRNRISCREGHFALSLLQ